MDGLRRQEKRRIEKEKEALEQETKNNLEKQSQTNVIVEQPKKERKSFLDKLTERVKDFLDNAE
jgi:cell division protein FtsA